MLPASLSQEAIDEIKMLSEDRWTRVYTQKAKDAFWARGKTYKSSFSPNDATYFPLLGPDKPRLFGFSMRSPSLAVGGEEIALEGDVVPYGSDAEVRYERGPMTEWYRLGTESIEQLFTFDAPLGPGALTVTIPVETELKPEPLDGGFLFRNELGGVHYGAATVLDAAGKEESAVTRWIDGNLEIEVPEAFLANARWPVTIDPLVVTFIVDDYLTELSQPDISYDLTTDYMIAVYQDRSSLADHDIFWRIFTRDSLTLVHEDYWEFTTEDWFAPRVANNSFSSSFLIVAEQLLPLDFYQIGYRVVDAEFGTQGLISGLSAREFVSNEDPDVGGEVVLTQASFWLVTWIERDTSGNRRVVCTRVNSLGTCLFDDQRLYQGPLGAHDPAVANSAGTQGKFNLAWTAGDGAARHIRGATVYWTGDVIHPDHSIVDLPDELSHPSITADLPGSSGRHLVVCQQGQGSIGTNLLAIVCQGATTLFSQDLSAQGGELLSAGRSRPRVDHDGERFGLVWVEHPGGPRSNIRASTLALAGRNLCESESRVPLGCQASLGLHGSPAIVSLFSSGGPSGSTYAAWTCDQLSQNIYGGHYELDPTDCIGRAYCNPAVPNSTGDLGRIRVRGSHFASAGAVVMSADQLPPNQFGFFICATGTSSFVPPGSNGRLCLGGLLGRYSGPGQVQSSGPNGTFSLGVSTAQMPTTPTQAVMPGQTWHFQAWHRDSVGAGSNFTRATAVQFD